MADTPREGKPPLVYPVQSFSIVVVEIKQFWHTSTLANPFCFLKVKTMKSRKRKRKKYKAIHTYLTG